MKVLITLCIHSSTSPKIVVDAGSVEEVKDQIELVALEYLDNINYINSQLSSDSSPDDIRRIKYEPYTVRFGEILVWGGAFIETVYTIVLEEHDGENSGFTYYYAAPHVEAIPDDTEVGHIDTENAYWAFEITEFLVGDDADV